MRENDLIVDPSYKCQVHGVLAKKPYGHQSNKWNKRFFIIKDGFLLYYNENERKDFEKKKIFNIHPKGSIPLGGCAISATVEPNQPFCIQISSGDINGNFTLSTDSEYERDRWLSLLQKSSRITWSNAQLGDAMIEQLEVQGLQMAKERQGYFDKLQYEAMALHDEKLRTEELEKLNEELHKERAKMETFAAELKAEYEKIKMELDTTTDAMDEVAQNKLHLNKHSDDLQTTLQGLEEEKQKTLKLLDVRNSETAKLSQEKQNLSAASEELQGKLKTIEETMRQLQEERIQANHRLEDAEHKAKQLEEDKKTISDHAEELKASIKELAEQKAITEAELKVEILARLDAERRLREAESSLGRLEKAVQQQGEPGRDTDEVKEEMMGDVKTLKKFFENLVFEAKLDADKPVMIKNAIHARKKMVRRARTMKFEQSKKRRGRDGSETSTVGSPVSPCEFHLSASAVLPDPRLTQSTIFLTESDLENFAWLRHSVIGLQHMRLSIIADEE